MEAHKSKHELWTSTSKHLWDSSLHERTELSIIKPNFSETHIKFRILNILKLLTREYEQILPPKYEQNENPTIDTLKLIVPKAINIFQKNKKPIKNSQDYAHSNH